MLNAHYITVFVDESEKPLGKFPVPVAFQLDTSKLVDGRHVLKIISTDNCGKEGIRIIPFDVRNGPAIAVEGIRDNELVSGNVQLMINAYGKGDQKSFRIGGLETPHSIPWWVMVSVLLFLAWSIYFLITSLSIRL